ncbi:hypothetical protein LDK02_05035 [Fusobacterium animalis]|jgi:hypothetical protein|uniref:hypothetical protein n=1 Tax=Fusobacterium animalis TaxID=76859 RepID=UPI0030D2E7CE
MAWSSFAHLPNNEEEYLKILIHLKNDMDINDVDRVIATIKKKEKIPYHYRSNLERLGLFKIEKGNILLNYNREKLVENSSLLKEILKKAVIENNSNEIKEIIDIVKLLNTYNLKSIVSELKLNYPFIDEKNLTRWIRPIVTLLKIIDLLNNYLRKIKELSKLLQNSYLKVAKKFKEIVALELVENELKKTDKNVDIVIILNEILNYQKIYFKIELLMLPNWATKNKIYKIIKNLFTHIRIEEDLLKELGDEKENKSK